MGGGEMGGEGREGRRCIRLKKLDSNLMGVLVGWRSCFAE